MKKVAITTITMDGSNEVNYGNRLQAYALQEFLRLNGYSPETIHYIKKIPEYTNCLPKRYSGTVWQVMDDIKRVLKRRIQRKKLLNKQRQRKEKFKKFEESNITFSKEVYTYDSDFLELGKKYDYYITGSDQVWNPYSEGYNPFYFLNYAPQGRRIVYAPSIAVDNIPKEIEVDFGKWVKGIDYLSIREESGKKLLKEKYGVDAQVVCDPVFLLDEKQWKRVSKNPNINYKYFLVYILGNKTLETKRLIKLLEKKFNAKAVDVYQRDNADTLFSGPEEFLGLIEHSEFVFTDSFHATAFSIVFRKPVTIVDRTDMSAERNMNSRIDNILNIIDAGERNAQFIVDNPHELWNMYTTKSDKFDKFIEESKAYLLRAFEKESEYMQ